MCHKYWSRIHDIGMGPTSLKQIFHSTNGLALIFLCLMFNITLPINWQDYNMGENLKFPLLNNVKCSIYIYEDDMQLGKLKENCLLLKLYRKTQKNVSEPQTGIEPATFWSPVRRSNHWATRTQMAERRPRCIPVIPFWGSETFFWVLW